jgi:hypothetical protein
MHDIVERPEAGAPIPVLRDEDRRYKERPPSVKVFLFYCIGNYTIQKNVDNLEVKHNKKLGFP